MIYTTQTTYPVETVKVQLEEKAKAMGFGVLGQYDFQQILHSKGFEITRDITVFEQCNPQAAQSALNTLPEISVFLPCRISVYRENGATVLATIGIEDILNAAGIEGELKEHLQELFKKIHALMNAW